MEATPFNAAACACLWLCRYFHKGSLAYVGGDQAVMDIPKVGPIFGREAGVMWKGYETFAQVRR